MTTLEERIAKINGKAQAQQDAEVALQQKNRTTNERLRLKCENLYDRVHNLVVLGNHCVKNGIAIGQRGYESKPDFYTNGIGHPCGFSSCPGSNTRHLLDRSDIKGIGIDGGGVWGYGYILLDDLGDVLFDGRTVRSLPAQNEAMNEFLRKFDEFEARFLKFIDEL